MDSSARLDYALFQLTPTRTRCDLVIFSGNRNEKLASGLLDPFISHLRCAKEQIPKGGYSITLRPPTSNASWFTKNTLERFVRFVSTPEVLERFVKIEREISQIEISVQSNEATQIEEAAADINANKSIVLHKPKVESNETNEAPREENSKVRLQRVLETRKVVLRKEQAMAYARAFVAGFEMDHLDDLISFSDAFGASRLREACINFKELCHKKHNDGLWMDELAAMQAFPQPELPYLGTSGIILTSESFPNAQLDPNGSLDASLSESTASHASSDINQGQPPTNANAQMPMPWSNHFPQFMYNFQRPGQQMPPYQGYPYPGMQVPPPYYPANMQWPPNTEESGHGQRESDHRRNRKSSSRKKEKSPNGRRSDPSEQDGLTEPSDSSSESDVDASSQHDRKHSSSDQHRKRRSGKKSSRTVVIRNINYITSKRKNGEDDGVSDESSTGEDELIDGASLKQKVEDAVGSLERHHKSTPHHSKKRGGKKNLSIHNESNGTANEELEDEQGTEKTSGNWDSFQNLLMRDDKSGPNEVEKQHGLDVRDEYFAMKSSESGASFLNSHAIDPESEKGTKQRMIATDSFILSNRDTANGSRTHLENFESNGISRPSMGRRDVADEELLFSQRMEDSGRNVHDTLADLNNESSVLKTQKGEDWYIVNQPEKSLGTGAPKVSSLYDGDHALKLEGDYFHEKPMKKDVFGDDSFMVQTRSVEDQPDSHWRTDMSMITALTAPSQEEGKTPDVSGDKLGVSGNYEPDDLCMVLERDLGVEPEGASWTPQMDYEVDSSFTAADKRHSGVQPDDVIEEDKLPTNGKTANGKSPAKKLSGKETKSKPREPLWKSKHEIISRPKKPSSVSRPAIQRRKSELEEESRRRMEELVIQRQKRIAERSAAKGPTPAAPKTSPVESKTTITKQTSRSTSQETKRLSLPKPSISSSTIDRLASVPAKQKGSSPPSSKSTPPKKTSSKVNGVAATSLSPKISKDDSKKQQPSLDQAKPSKSVNDLDHQEVTCSDVKDQQTNHATNDLATSETLKGPSDPSSTITRDEPEKMSDVISGVKECDQVPVNRSPIEDNDKGTSNVTPVLYEEKTIDHSSQTNGFNTERVEDHLPTTPEKDLSSTAVNLEEDIDTTNQKLLVSSEITETEIMPGQVESIPPPMSGMSPDPIHTRKKWTSNESPPPAAKGLKKLLMFGRKSSSPIPT